MKRVPILLCVFAFGFLLNSVLSAQVRNPNQAEPRIETQRNATKQQQKMIKVFALKSIDPALAVDVISTLVDGKECRMAVDSRSNGLIVSGTAETLATIEAVLLKLDEGSGKKTSVFPLRNIPVKDAAKMLSQQFGNVKDVKIMSDSRQNALLLSGSENAVKKVKSLLEAIDVSPAKGKLAGRNVLVYAYWIVDQDSVADRFPEWKLSEVPESIQTLVKQKLAKRTNIKKPLMAANLAVQTLIGDSLQTNSVIQNSGGSRISDTSSYQIEIDGAIWNTVSSNDKVDLEIQMQIALKDKNKLSSVAQVQTRISTPLNHPVCLGMTPVNGVDSILVLEIVEAD